jgi:hypothetical protein
MATPQILSLMKSLKTFFIPLICHSIVLPFYGLNVLGSVSNVFSFMTLGFKEMFIPAGCALAIYYSIKYILNEKLKIQVHIIMMILTMLVILLLSQFAWSFMIHSGKYDFNNFIESWGFYFPSTILISIMIPLLDRFYSKRERAEQRQHV